MKLVLLLVLCILNGKYGFRLSNRGRSLLLLRPEVSRPSATHHSIAVTPPALESAAIPLVRPTQDYDWEKKWYAVCFEENFPSGNALPLAYSVFGRRTGDRQRGTAQERQTIHHQLLETSGRATFAAEPSRCARRNHYRG